GSALPPCLSPPSTICDGGRGCILESKQRGGAAWREKAPGGVRGSGGVRIIGQGRDRPGRASHCGGTSSIALLVGRGGQRPHRRRRDGAQARNGCLEPRCFRSMRWAVRRSRAKRRRRRCG